MKQVLKLAAIALCAFVTACSTRDVKEPISKTPTMGWSSWNTYSINISDSLIMSQADAMVKTGLKDVGFKYINIDDGYFGGRDLESGQLLIHPTRFPGGMKPVVDHIHSLGLKAGIYSDAGYNTCGNYWNRDSIAQNVGLYGHEKQDAEFFFNELGFDFIKVDFCGGTAWQNNQRLALDPQARYTAIHEAIESTGRKDVRLNVCRWDYPGTWVSDVSTSWRISGDISSRWQSVRGIIAQNLYLSAYAFDGHFNDMDMLEVGRTMSAEEDRTHFGIWCIMASPLLIGCDMTNLKPETLELLLNQELIALNQDPLYQQAYVVRHDGETYVLAKDLLEREGLVRAAALYNPTDEPLEISVDMADLCLTGTVKIRDLFAHEDLASVAAGGTLTLDVPAHGCRIVRLEAEGRAERTLYEAETAYLSSYQELYNANVVGSAYYQANDLASGRMVATGLGGTPVNDIRWRNVYSADGGRYALTFRCIPNERSITPPGRMGQASGGSFYVAVGEGDGQMLRLSGTEGVVEVTVEVTLSAGDNEIRLYNDRGTMPDIDCMVLSSI